MIRGFQTFQELRARFPKLQSDSATYKENVFVSLTLPSEKDLIDLHVYCQCHECRSAVRLVAFDLNDNCAALMLRCISCYEDQFFFITKERTTSSDVCIFRMSPKLKSTQSLFAGFKCLSCKQPVQGININTTAYDIKTIIATHLRCSKCRECMNIIFWDPPRNYYQYSLNMGDSVKHISPQVALVFYVSALENYLQKAFLSASSFNKYLVLKRCVSFQNLEEAKDIFKEYFNLDIAKLAANDWQKMIDAVKKRNMIIHNAGHDKNFNLIDVDDTVASTTRETISTFVDTTLRHELRKRFVD
jgi:hypothetical protein